MLVLGAALALVIGVVLGMLGGGGGILTLPMLVYALGVTPKEAVATSLVVVGVTSVAGAAMYARQKLVVFRVGGVFASTAMAGAYAGGRLARFVPDTALLVLFGALMVATALSMLRGRGSDDGGRPPRLALFLALGAAVGVVSGLVGAGGGFIIVPALVLFGGLPMREAVGTSLFVIALQSAAGFLGHAGHVTLDLELVAVVTVASVAGSLAGAQLSERVPAPVLRKGFAWLVIAMGMFLFAKQLRPELTLGIGAVVLVAVGLLRRRPGSPASDTRPGAARAAS